MIARGRKQSQLREPGHPPFVLAGIAQPQPMTVPKIAICSTNYNCVHALEAHLRSVFLAFQGLDFGAVAAGRTVRIRSTDHSVTNTNSG